MQDTEYWKENAEAFLSDHAPEHWPDFDTREGYDSSYALVVMPEVTDDDTVNAMRTKLERSGFRTLNHPDGIAILNDAEELNVEYRDHE